MNTIDYNDNALFKINKLLGFLTLNYLHKEGLPCVRTEEYNSDTHFTKDKLWTLRTAVLNSFDFYLPRLYGATANESYEWISSLDQGKKYHIFYYPYFISSKSGTLWIKKNECVIESVNGELINFTRGGNRNVTITFSGNPQHISTCDPNFEGDDKFLNEDEICSIIQYVPKLAELFYEQIYAEYSILIEWSFCQSSDLRKKPYGPIRLKFCGMRILRQ